MWIWDNFYFALQLLKNMCTIVCYEREIDVQENMNLFDKEKVTNNSLLWKKDNTLNLLEIKCVCNRIWVIR